MSFNQLCQLHAIIKALNANGIEEPVEFWFPHMFKDGCWAVDVVFSKITSARRFAPVFSFVLSCSLDSFLFTANGDISIHIQ